VVSTKSIKKDEEILINYCDSRMDEDEKRDYLKKYSISDEK
jgi:hypothetical protein